MMQLLSLSYKRSFRVLESVKVAIVATVLFLRSKEIIREM